MYYLKLFIIPIDKEIMCEKAPSSLTTSYFEDTVKRINQLKDDIVNLSMETRLSVEMEMEGTLSLFSKVNASLQSIVEKYQQLNKLYVKECAHRRKVPFVLACK